MIIRAEEKKETLVSNMRGGDGAVAKCDFALEQMPDNARVLAELRLEPGCSIGVHRHTDEYEIFFYKEGEIVLNDNGTERVMYAGDFSICYDGECHGIANRSDKPAAVYAAVIKTK